MKDLIEETLFAQTRDLFTSLELVFFDTTSIYFEGEGGHVFCSFLALMLLKELLGRIERRGWEVQWERLRDDLDALEEITIHTAGRSFVVRSAAEGVAGKAIQAAGVALGSAVRLLDDRPPLPPAGKRARSANDIPC